METQYLLPGGEFHDEIVSEGEYLIPGDSFINNGDGNVPAPPTPSTARPVFFVCT